MKKKEIEKWEIEFDEQFTLPFGMSSSSGMSDKEYEEVKEYGLQFKNWWDVKGVKSFIRNLLSQSHKKWREDTIKEIEKMKRDPKEWSVKDSFGLTFSTDFRKPNEIIDDIISLIKK
jgi:hypothetical protein